MENRKTIAFTTQEGNHKIVINAYLTKGEQDRISAALMKDAKLDLNSKKFEPVSGAALIEQQKEILKVMLVSVDDVAENPVAVLDDLDQNVYAEVLSQINEATRLKNFPSTK